MAIQTKVWAEGVVCIALSAVLYSITLFTMPQGGRITAGSMIPILWFALRRGARLGIFVGIVLGLVVLAIEPFIFHPIQVLLDYPIAFGLLGLAGLFKRLPLLGVGIGIVGRFLSHFVSGVIFFSSYAPEGMNPAIYSALYNGSYMLVEFIVSSIIIFVLVKRKLLEIYR